MLGTSLKQQIRCDGQISRNTQTPETALGRNTESEKTYKSKEIELVTQTVHRGKPGHVASLVDSIRHLKNNQYQPFGTSSKLIEEKGALGGLL